MDKYTISSGLIFNNKNQILLAKHVPEFGAGYYWYIPGGTANKNEKVLDALKREIKEETNIDININKIDELAYTAEHINHKREWHSDIVELKWFDIKQAIDVIKNVPFRVMREPLVNYLKMKKPKKYWVYVEYSDGKIELLK